MCLISKVGFKINAAEQLIILNFLAIVELSFWIEIIMTVYVGQKKGRQSLCSPQKGLLKLYILDIIQYLNY